MKLLVWLLGYSAIGLGKGCYHFQSRQALMRNLIVMRVGDEAGADPEQGEGLDLQVGRLQRDVRLVERDLAVALFVHILRQKVKLKIGPIPASF